MKMPKARGKEWLVACRDDLSGITECKAITKDRAKVIARFFLKRIILRYGIVQEVVTDNGPSFGKEFAELLKTYGINQIRISPYNSQANGAVERGHYNIREALVKLCDGDLSKWPLMVSAACYADRITVRQATGYSPFYLLHGVHPLMPGDLADATFQVTSFKPGMTSAELIEARTRQLLKLPQDVETARNILRKSRFKSKQNYERKFARRLRLEAYEPDTLVLVRNNPIENSVSIERKTANRYMGPYRVVRQTQGGSYALAEMDGALLRHNIAAYRLIPYVQRKDLNAWAKEIESSTNMEDESDSNPSRSNRETESSSSDSDSLV
jgi:transposase InsO family protein